MTTVYEESHKELKEFVQWFNRHKGFHPIIIGGWAVYYYNPYFESKDIDVVFEYPRAAWDQPLLEYLGSHEYLILDKEKHELTKDRDSPALIQTLRKSVGKEYIDIDACSTSDPNFFHNPAFDGKEVPYSLAAKNNVTVKIPGTDATYRIPTIELLLLYKIKAFNDRDYRSKHAIDQKDIEYFLSKRDKDGSDIIALLDQKHCKSRVNFELLNQLTDKLEIRNMLRETISQVFNNSASMNAYRKLVPRQIAQDIYNPLISKLLYATKPREQQKSIKKSQ